MAVDREKVLQAAQKLVEKKRYDKAIAEYQKIVAEDPKDARTLLKIGDCYSKLEQYPEAIQTYERVGQFYSAQGFAVKAIAVYKQICELIQKHVPHLEDRYGHIAPRLAEIYTQLGLISDALAAYDEMATRLQRSGRDRDALDVFRKVVELDPTNPLPYLRLADAFLRVKDLEAAVSRYGVAAEILLKLGRRDDTLKVLEQLLKVRPEPRFARMAAEIYLDRGGANDGMVALTKLQICFKDNPKDLETLALLSRAFDKLGQGAKAVEVQKEAARIAKEGGRLDAYNAIVDALLIRAPHDDAVRQLAAHRGPPGAPSMLPSSRGSVEVDLDDAEEVDVLDDSQAEAPFALRQSQPSIQSYRPPKAASVPPPSIDPATRARQALTRAEAHRRAKQYDQAVSTLETALREVPAARELHEKLCDMLIEAGDQDGAVRQMLVFARTLGEDGDVDAAARVLDEVLLLEPNLPQAVEMLRSLGYAVPTDGYEDDSAIAVDENGAPYAPQGPGYDPEAPLPAYDLEESAPEARPLAAFAPQLDDPFTTDEPLPSFPMEDEDAGRFAPPPPMSSPRRSPPPPSMPEAPRSGNGLPLSGELPHAVMRADAPPAQLRVDAPHPSQRGSDGVHLDEDALEEVEFFAQHGMFEEARNILEEQLSRLPNHPLLLERLRELEALASGTAVLPQESGARELPRSTSPGDLDADADRSFDIAASLDALDALDALEASAPTGPEPGSTEQVSVEAVFEQFKAGVAAHVSESDAATHYDLGVAYREMGLYPDAIEEFRLASRDPARECVCWSMIGALCLDTGQVDDAIHAFIRGLRAQERTIEQEMTLNYEVGNAYEMRNSPEHALYFFQRVARINPHYADPRGSVEDRIARLQPPPAAAQVPTSARAVGAELVSDEFDAAFDELLSRGGKLP